MSLEFIVKNGLISKGNVIVTGSITTTNFISGTHTGSTFGTSSWSVNSNSSSWSPSQNATTLFTGSIYQITTSNSISASYAPSNTTYTSSLFGTASWANNSISASYSPGGSPATYTSSLFGTASWANNINPYQSYTLLTTSSTNWVTISFNNPNYQVNLTNAAVYSFTSSNNSSIGQVSDILVYVSHSAVGTSSLSFPTTWQNIGNGWPTSINANTVGVLWLRSIDPTTIIGTFNMSGSVFSASYAISASYAPGGSTATYTSSLFGTASWTYNSITSSYITPYQFYVTLLTSSTNWITTSFNNSNYQLNLPIASAYNFTSSNNASNGQISDILIYISHSANNTSSLSFPSTWKNIGSGWPTGINANTIGVLWIRSIDTNTIIGSFNISGSVFSASYSLQSLSSSYSQTASFSLNSGGGSGTTLFTGSIYPITASWSVSASWAPSGGGVGVDLLQVQVFS